MRKWFTTLAVLIALWVVFPAQAQSGLTLSSVSVDIWPEYDQPAVLVIYHISMPANTTLPVTLNLRVPAQAEAYAVAISDPTKGLLNAPYDRTVQGTWATLAITANAKEVQVEYYDTLVKNGTARHIVYEWAGDYAVDSFAVDIQQPTGATNMVTNPVLPPSPIGQDGFIYYETTPQPLSAGQTFTLTADYHKDNRCFKHHRTSGATDATTHRKHTRAGDHERSPTVGIGGSWWGIDRIWDRGWILYVEKWHPQIIIHAQTARSTPTGKRDR